MIALEKANNLLDKVNDESVEVTQDEIDVAINNLVVKEEVSKMALSIAVDMANNVTEE